MSNRKYLWQSVKTIPEIISETELNTEIAEQFLRSDEQVKQAISILCRVIGRPAAIDALLHQTEHFTRDELVYKYGFSKEEVIKVIEAYESECID